MSEENMYSHFHFFKLLKRVVLINLWFPWLVLDQIIPTSESLFVDMKEELYIFYQDHCKYRKLQVFLAESYSKTIAFPFISSLTSKIDLISSYNLLNIILLWNTCRFSRFININYLLNINMGIFILTCLCSLRRKREDSDDYVE